MYDIGQGRGFMLILALLFIVFAALGYGIMLFVRPVLVIELQQRFYEKINWRMEPISMQKEIRNTRIMGVFLIGVTVAAVLFMVFNWEFF
jgi:phosphotransferase system  glucose/maltose/N-acetylglucosamine-specific IIC component